LCPHNRGARVLSGPYIDLNPGTPERLVRAATRRRFGQVRRAAAALGAAEVVFLSSFLPLVGLASYEAGWVARSVAFWRAYLDGADPRLTVALGNTFEASPEPLARVAEGVDRPAFRLALDLGHFLVYAELGLDAWVRRIAPYCSTVYVHSNDGRADTHEAPPRGALTADHVARVAAALPATTKFILKMADKGAITPSAAWLRAALA
jgi:sugar phosphate isomerase/epimerase